MSNINLLNLPREIRDLIYPYVLPKRLQLALKGCDRSLTFFETNGILLATHQLRDEALDAFYRLLPMTTIVAPRDVRIPFLTSPNYARIRERTTNLLIKKKYRKRNLDHFALSRMSDLYNQLSIARVLENMPGLRLITCEITWEPSHAPTVLLPRIKECMLKEFRRVTVGQNELLGWDVECRVKDKARWRNEWSGVVILRKN